MVFREYSDGMEKMHDSITDGPRHPDEDADMMTEKEIADELKEELIKITRSQGRAYCNVCEAWVEFYVLDACPHCKSDLTFHEETS